MTAVYVFAFFLMVWLVASPFIYIALKANKAEEDIDHSLEEQC